jgi:hypothetical protein
MTRDELRDELVFVGYTNGDQILYGAQDEGSFYNSTENECFIPLYMLKRHWHRIESTSNMRVTLDMVKEAQARESD